MAKFNVNDVLGKLNELKAVFVLSQRALPFIEDIFSFLQEVVPLLEEINASMMDSALKMPHATLQLQNISVATKTAATEILDLIDEVLIKSQTYEGHLDQTAIDVKLMEESDEQLLVLLHTRLEDRSDIIAEVEELLTKRRQVQHSIEGSIHARRTVVDEIRTQMNMIADSLQVQDITAQQIASVTHLLDSMRDRMSALLERLDAQQYDPDMAAGGLDMPENATFDVRASYDRSDERQRAVDDVFDAAGRGDGGPESDDTEIDQLFRDAATALEMRRNRNGGG